MEVFKIKATQEPVLMLTKSKDTNIIINANKATCKTFNVVNKLDGTKVAISDDDIEFVGEEADE